MPTLRVVNIELQASYDAIPSSFSMRPSPQRIALEMFQKLSLEVDFEAAFAVVRNKTYTDANAKAAIEAAHTELMTEINNRSSNFEVGYAAAVYYRPMGTSHITEYFLSKKSSGETPQAWPFTVNINGTEVTGYVTLMTLTIEESSELSKTQLQGESQRPASFVRQAAFKREEVGSGS